MKSLTQAVSGADVDLEDGYTAPRSQPRFPFHHHLTDSTCQGERLRNQRSKVKHINETQLVEGKTNKNVFLMRENQIY